MTQAVRRGCKNDPFKIGERVIVYPIHKEGKVTKITHPDGPRVPIRYTVVVCFGGTYEEKEFVCWMLGKVK